jgi:NADH dehydrogenase
VSILAALGVKLDRAGRVPVRPDLLVEGLDGVFVIGDAAAFSTGENRTLPGVAQVALQQGAHAARNIMLTIKGQPMTTFSYKDLGSMATIGRNRAVAVSGKLQFTGFLGWMAWLFVHLIALVGFRNRMAVLLEWTWAYLSYQRSARLILETAVGKPYVPPNEATRLALAATVAAPPPARSSGHTEPAPAVSPAGASSDT